MCTGLPVCLHCIAPVKTRCVKLSARDAQGLIRFKSNLRRRISACQHPLTRLLHGLTALVNLGVEVQRVASVVSTPP
jgi:hypothetical protein